MNVARLPTSVTTLYAELMDQLRACETLSLGARADGSFVSKVIRGKTYWYLQRVEAGTKRQTYLGRETPELLSEIRTAKEGRAVLSDDIKRRRELVAMLVAGGAAATAAPVTRVMQMLSETLVFRAGGVLVGTHAFSCYANMLGVRFEAQSLRTADIDIAQQSGLSIGIGNEGHVDLVEKLKQVEPRFVPVPALDVREPSTSFFARGRDIRVDFITAAMGRNQSKPVPLPHLHVAAQPIPGLEYLIERSVPAAVVGNGGVLVNVPLPGRYALHKLWVSATRSVADQAKASKDLVQAEQLIEVLLEDRPDDVEQAADALKIRRGMWKRVRPRLQRIVSAEIFDRLTKGERQTK